MPGKAPAGKRPPTLVADAADAPSATPPARSAADRLGSFHPVRIRKAADVVVDILVDAIRNGLYAPGEKLPRERDLAAQLEVSRTTIREATSILQRAGILSVRRGNGGGAVVLSRAIPPALLSSVQRLDRADELRSLLEVRRPLELLAGVLAVRRGTEEMFEEIRQLITQLEALTDLPVEFMHYDLQVHMRVAEASQNNAIVRYLDEIYKQQSAIRAEYPVETFDMNHAVRLHRAALDALISRDEAKIVRIVDEHLGSVEMHIFGERLSGFELPDEIASPAVGAVRPLNVHRHR